MKRGHDWHSTVIGPWSVWMGWTCRRCGERTYYLSGTNGHCPGLRVVTLQGRA